VRALYLLTAVADLINLNAPETVKIDESQDWHATLRRLWGNMVDKKM
jgi:hypothetical protein